MAELQAVWRGSEMRKRMHPVFDTVDFSNRREVRKAFYNADGEDVRQQTMGVRWGLMKERRAGIVEEFKEAIHEAFDKLMEKLSAQKSQRSSLDVHFLPNMTTPAVPKTRSRLAKTNAQEAIRVMDIEGDSEELAEVTRPQYAKASVREGLKAIEEGKPIGMMTCERVLVETVKKAAGSKKKPVKVEAHDHSTSMATINAAQTVSQGIPDITNSAVQELTDKPVKTRAGRPRGRRAGSDGTQTENSGPTTISKALPATTRVTRARARMTAGTRAKKDPVVPSRGKGKEGEPSQSNSAAILNNAGLILDKAMNVPELSAAVPPQQPAWSIHICSEQQQKSVSVDSHDNNGLSLTTTEPEKSAGPHVLRQKESEVGEVVATTASKKATRSRTKKPSVDPCADDNLAIIATELKRTTRSRTLRQRESEMAGTTAKRTTRSQVKKVDKVTSLILEQLTAVEPASAVRRSTRSRTKKPDTSATAIEENTLSVPTTAPQSVTCSMTEKMIPAVEPLLERDSDEQLIDDTEAAIRGKELSPSNSTSPNLSPEMKRDELLPNKETKHDEKSPNKMMHDERLPNKEGAVIEDELSSQSDVSLKLATSHQIQPAVATAVDPGEIRSENILKETAKLSVSSEEDGVSHGLICDPPPSPPLQHDSAVSADQINTHISEADTPNVGELNTLGKSLQLSKENEIHAVTTSDRKRSSRILDKVVISRLSSLVPSRPSPPPPGPHVAEEGTQSPWAQIRTENEKADAVAVSGLEQPLPGAGNSSPAQAVDSRCEALSRDSDVSTCSTLTCVSATEDESCLQPSQAKKKKLPLKLRKTKKKKGARGRKKVAEALSDSLQDNDGTAVDVNQVADPEAEKERDATSGDSETATDPEKESERQESEQLANSVMPSTLHPSSSSSASTLPFSSSADSLYESCLSEIESTTPSKPQTKAKKPKKKAKHLRVPTPYSSPAQVVPLAKTPSQNTPNMKSPATVSSSTSTYADPLIAGSPAASAKAVHTPLGTPSLPISPSRLPFLMGTPKTLKKLQEEHQLKRSRGTGARGQDATPLSKRLRGPSRVASPAQSQLLKTTPHHRPATPTAIVSAGAKRLRSVSLEKLPESISAKRPSLEPSPLKSKLNKEEEEEVEEEGIEGGSSEDSGSDGVSENTSSEKLLKSSTVKTRPNIMMSFFTKKTQAQRMELPAKLPLLAAHPVSFLPRNSPRKVVNQHELRKEKLRKKAEEDERRIREMENRKQQELREKKRQAEERLKKAAANRAALEEKRKAKDQGASRNDQSQLVKRAKELEAKEKSRKHKERMAAAEARRREEEEKKLKRCQEIEEERRMKDELAKKRLEAGEYEKKQKRLDIQKQEKERQLHREREEEVRRKLEEQLQLELARKQQEQTRKEGERQRFEAEKKRFEQLSESLAKSSVTSAPSQPSSFIPQWKQARTVTKEANANMSTTASHSGTVTKTKPTIPQPRIITANIPTPIEPSQEKTNTISSAGKQQFSGKENSAVRDKPCFVSPTETSLLNRTFNIYGGTTCTKVLPRPQSPTSSSPNLPQKYTQASYEMTPMSYDIADLSSEDSTDDEDCPKKPIPVWAHSSVLSKVVEAQEEKASKNMIDITKIFPPRQLLKSPDLARIFTKKRRRFFCRSSSANWHSPMLKKTRIGQ